MIIVKGLSGVFAATDILMGHKPFYEPPKKTDKPEDKGFQKILDREIDVLKKRG